MAKVKGAIHNSVLSQRQHLMDELRKWNHHAHRSSEEDDSAPAPAPAPRQRKAKAEAPSAGPKKESAGEKVEDEMQQRKEALAKELGQWNSDKSSAKKTSGASHLSAKRKAFMEQMDKWNSDDSKHGISHGASHKAKPAHHKAAHKSQAEPKSLTNLLDKRKKAFEAQMAKWSHSDNSEDIITNKHAKAAKVSKKAKAHHGYASLAEKKEEANRKIEDRKEKFREMEAKWTKQDSEPPKLAATAKPKRLSAKRRAFLAEMNSWDSSDKKKKTSGKKADKADSDEKSEAKKAELASHHRREHSSSSSSSGHHAEKHSDDGASAVAAQKRKMLAEIKANKKADEAKLKHAPAAHESAASGHGHHAAAKKAEKAKAPEKAAKKAGGGGGGDPLAAARAKLKREMMKWKSRDGLSARLQEKYSGGKALKKAHAAKHKADSMVSRRAAFLKEMKSWKKEDLMAAAPKTQLDSSSG